MDDLTAIRFRQAEASQRAETPALAAAAAHARADELAASAPARAAWACREGCAACCHLLVRVKPAETERIVEHLLDARDGAERRELRRRLEESAQSAVGLSPGAYRRARVRCAFLDEDDRCSIYEVRPLKCRAHVSRSAAACGDPTSPVPFDAWLAKVGEALHAGLSDDATEELHLGVLARLDGRA